MAFSGEALLLRNSIIHEKFVINYMIIRVKEKSINKINISTYNLLDIIKKKS